MLASVLFVMGCMAFTKRKDRKACIHSLAGLANSLVGISASRGGNLVFDDNLVRPSAKKISGLSHRA